VNPKTISVSTTELISASTPATLARPVSVTAAAT